MKRLHWFVFKSFLGPLFATFFICMFILFLQFLWMYADDIVGKGLETNIIIELFFYICIQLVPTALPLSVLLSSIMTFGNLGENYELIACKASGISLFRVMRPLIILTVFITCAAFLFSNNIVPHASLKGGVLLRDIKKAKPEMIIKEGVFTHLQDFSIKVDHINKNTSLMHDIIVYSHINNPSSNNEVIVADSGRIIVSDNGSTDFIFYSGNIYKEDNDRKRDKYNEPFTRIKYSEYRMSIVAPKADFQRTDESIFSNSYKMLNVTQLDYVRDSLIVQLKEDNKNFAKRRLSYDYLQQLNRYDKDTTNIDTLVVPFVNYDSLMLASNIDKKSRMIGVALRKARQMSSQVANRKSPIAQSEERIRRYNIEWHDKFRWSLACLIFFFIGAPLGGIIRKGGLGMPVVVSVIFFILYYVISMTGVRSAREGVLTPFQGVWLSSFIIVPIAIVITWQAVTDAPIMSSEKYTNFLRRFGLYKEKKSKDKK
ncbi:MAG: LptF/LptG family permease [Marinifilaceae bacterium]